MKLKKNFDIVNRGKMFCYLVWLLVLYLICVFILKIHVLDTLL